MGSAYTQDLASLLRERVPDRSEVRPRLLRLASAMDERVQSVDESSVAFVRSAVRVLRKLDPLYDPDIQFRCLTSAVPFLYAHAELDTALLAAHGMVLIGRQTQRKDLARKGFNFLGIIDKTSGNFADAIVHFQHALSLAQELRDVRSEISVLGNLAGAFVEAALFREALPCFQRADALSEQYGDLHDRQMIEERAMSLVNQSHLFLRLGDLRSAYRAAQRSTAFWLEPESLNDFVSRTLRAAHYVYLSLQFGKVEEAKRHAEACQLYAARNPTEPSVFFASLAAGLVQVAAGHATHGLKLLEDARAQAGRVQQTSLMADAWISLTWAYEQLHQPEDALACLRALRQHVVDCRSRAVSALLSQTSDLLGNDEFDLMALNYREARLQAEVSNNARLGAEIDLLQRLATAATLRDDASGLHGHRVGRLSALVAAKLGWNPRQCWSLEISARLHDIGKSGLPDHILLSPDALKEAERDFLKAHSAIGHALLANAPSKELSEAAEVALYHHEHWDGSGYPKGLADARIPISARIVAIADVFDALTHGRPYAEPWHVEQAIAEIESASGTHFDPDICTAFVGVLSDLRRTHTDLDAFLTIGVEASPFMAARRRIEEMTGASRDI
jgi:putative two-component system response regulator